MAVAPLAVDKIWLQPLASTPTIILVEMDTSQTRSLCGLVILAAGQGTRFGGAKQTVLFRDHPLVSYAINTALSVAQYVSPVRIVTGAHCQEVEEVVAPLLASHANLRLCHNATWSSGLASSLQTGLQSLECEAPPVGAVIFMLGDQPFVSAELLVALQERWCSGWEMVAPAQAGRLLGAPALFARNWWPAIGHLQGDRGARKLLEQHHSLVGLVEVNSDRLIDIDTLEDLASYENTL